MASGQRKKNRERRKQHVRRQLCFEVKPLLTVYRSTKHMYAQIVDPVSGRTITSVSTRSPSVRDGLKSTGDIEAASKVGHAVARLALERKIQEVAFNRNGFVFRGRVRALAEGAREGGLRF